MIKLAESKKRLRPKDFDSQEPFDHKKQKEEDPIPLCENESGQKIDFNIGINSK